MGARTTAIGYTFMVFVPAVAIDLGAEYLLSYDLPWYAVGVVLLTVLAGADTGITEHYRRKMMSDIQILQNRLDLAEKTIEKLRNR